MRWPLALALAAALTQSQEAAQRARDPDPGVRCRAVEALRKTGTPEAAEAILPLLADAHPRVRLRAAAALSGMPEACGALRRGLRDDDPLIRMGCAGCLAEDESVRPLLEDPIPEVRAAAIRALGAASAGHAPRSPEERIALLDAAGTEASRLAALDDPDPRVRIAAAEGSADPPVGRLLADRDWRVRSIGVDRAVAGGEIAPLVERLRFERGRLAHEILEGLHALTGERFETARQWERWARRSSSGPPRDPAAGANPTRLEGEGFFGVPVASERAAFVLDLSGSMRGEKLRAAREALVRAVRRLSSEARFEVVLLGCEADGSIDRASRVWAGRLEPATEAARARAEEFVRSREARGYTNLFDALAIALETPGVDTVYLFSDGGPSRGTFVQAEEILSRVAAMNRFRRIRIHAVQPAEEGAPERHARLMRGLAEGSGGVYLLRPL